MVVSQGRLVTVALLALGAIGLAGCDRKMTGPNEFTVVQRAPLSVPPDFGLRPPRPGERRPNEAETRDTARSTILGAQQANQTSGLSLTLTGANPTATAEPGFSTGEQALLKQAGALNVDPDIRSVLARESGRVEEDRSLVDRLVFWRDGSQEKPAVVDAAAETQRLRDNAALGIPPTEGITPIQQQ